MKTIEVSEKVYRRLQSLAEPMVDTPSMVIEKLLEWKLETRNSKRVTEGEGTSETQAAKPETRNPKPGAACGPPRSHEGGERARSDGEYTHRRPVGFVFEGKHYTVGTFKDVYMELCGLMAALHPKTFAQVVTLRGRERAYFSESRDGMTHPQRVEGTTIYAETNFSARNIMERCRELVGFFGHDGRELVVKLKEGEG